MVLSEKELQVLKILFENDRSLSSEEIASLVGDTSVTSESVISICQKAFLPSKLVTETTDKQTVYELTDEGQLYLKEGLPEKKLVELLKKLGGSVDLNDLRKQFPDKAHFNIGITWSRKNDWLTFKKDKQTKKTSVSLNEKADFKTAVEDVLNLFPTKKEVSFDEIQSKKLLSVIEEAKKRNMIKEKIKKTNYYTITAEGRKTYEKVKKISKGIVNLTPEILKKQQWKEHPLLPIKFITGIPRIHAGYKHPYLEFLEEVREILVGLGFTESIGPIVELEFWNCDALFMPQDHIARDVHDIYHIQSQHVGQIFNKNLLHNISQTHENGWKTGSTGWGYRYSEDIARRLVLRSHTTAVSARYLADNPSLPLRMFSIDRNFRPEKLDATHLMEFYQCEGIIGDEKLSLRDLFGYLTAICNALGIKDIRFKPGFFPFTEPSVEGFIKHPTLGWIEALPGGIFRPEVVRPLGIKGTVLAWGLGVDRLAMAALDISDIRDLFSHDLGYLRSHKIRKNI